MSSVESAGRQLLSLRQYSCDIEWIIKDQGRDRLPNVPPTEATGRLMCSKYLPPLSIQPLSLLLATIKSSGFTSWVSFTKGEFRCRLSIRFHVLSKWVTGLNTNLCDTVILKLITLICAHGLAFTTVPVRREEI
ncbi:hypothetical protein M404DRAFT_1001056 [Pisolithus tinctorius Marx 270]|uniref:Uncharacterized protein n=1 Tax=Pisolithus tinctorius Marx 270 TaxID=870435 RepID=A0A0C3P8T0_PISTI|nr:hypothetical protein M404DRAFT_1001056 [Pisolithus tinctorius Marx 270]